MTQRGLHFPHNVCSDLILTSSGKLRDREENRAYYQGPLNVSNCGALILESLYILLYGVFRKRNNQKRVNTIEKHVKFAAFNIGPFHFNVNYFCALRILWLASRALSMARYCMILPRGSIYDTIQLTFIRTTQHVLE